MTYKNLMYRKSRMFNKVVFGLTALSLAFATPSLISGLKKGYAQRHPRQAIEDSQRPVHKDSLETMASEPFPISNEEAKSRLEENLEKVQEIPGMYDLMKNLTFAYSGELPNREANFPETIIPIDPIGKTDALIKSEMIQKLLETDYIQKNGLDNSGRTFTKNFPKINAIKKSLGYDVGLSVPEFNKIFKEYRELGGELYPTCMTLYDGEVPDCIPEIDGKVDTHNLRWGNSTGETLRSRSQ
ncbi:MAG: hypothetical protein KKF67_02600, partial [Nanoarchaeota archaeon]|nr:hypothetical protein [Nanoarchaeota archaeon]